VYPCSKTSGNRLKRTRLNAAKALRQRCSATASATQRILMVLFKGRRSPVGNVEAHQAKFRSRTARPLRCLSCVLAPRPEVRMRHDGEP
jgi:hypothetical protein